MKRIMLFVLIACLALNLCGCGNKGPSVRAMKEDIRGRMSDTYPGISDFNLKVRRSITEDEVYTADLDIEARGQYADFAMEGIVFYVNYGRDGNWELRDCALNKTSYEIYRYPSAEELVDYLMRNEEEEYTDAFLTEEDDGAIVGYTIKNENWGYTFNCNNLRTFIFEPEEERWLYDSEKDSASASDPRVIAELDGTYHFNQYRGSFSQDYFRHDDRSSLDPLDTITISDVTNNAITLSDGPYAVPVTFTFNSESWPYRYEHVFDDGSYEYLEFNEWEERRIILVTHVSSGTAGANMFVGTNLCSILVDQRADAAES